MQEDRPFLPREIERALEFLDVGHHPEAALGVGVIERIRDGRRRFHRPRFAAGGDNALQPDVVVENQVLQVEAVEPYSTQITRW